MNRKHALGVLLASICLTANVAAAQSPTQPSARTVVARDTLAGALGLSLDEAIRRAADRSKDVRIARAAVLRAQGLERQARSQFFPQLASAAAYTRSLRSEFDALTATDAGPPAPAGPCDQYLRDAAAALSDRVAGLESAQRCVLKQNPLSALGRLGFGSENQYSLGLSLSQNLFAGGRVLAQTAALRAVTRAAEIGLTSRMAQVVLTVTQAYLDAALADRLAAIAELSLQQSENTVRQTQLAREVGTTSEFDLLRARVARDNQVPLVIQRRSDREVALLRLRHLLDLPLEAPLALTTSVEDTSAGIRAVAAAVHTFDTSVAQRAPVRQAVAGVDAQRSLVRAARAQRLPAISVSSQYGRVAYPVSGFPASGDFRENWTIALGAQLPLFTGGRLRGEEDVARANLNEARARLDQARELAALDTRVQANALDQAEATWRASAGTAEQAARAYEIAAVRYREGISTQLELDDSRLLLEQARVNRAVAARNLQMARVRVALLPDLPIQLQNTQNASGNFQ